MFTGVPIIYGLNPKSTQTTAQHALGTMGVTSDGRMFRYAQNAGVEIGAGLLCVAADITTNHEDMELNTYAVGDKTLDITLGGTAVVGNEYQEGFVMVVDSAGEGHYHKMKSAPAQSNTTGTFTPILYDPIEVAADANTTVTIVRNKYRDVVVSDRTLADLPVGVCPIVIPVDAYFWVQKKGYCTILVDSNNTTAGQPITIGDNGSGAVELHDAATEVIVGHQPVGANSDAGEYGIYILNLE